MARKKQPIEGSNSLEEIFGISNDLSKITDSSLLFINVCPKPWQRVPGYTPQELLEKYCEYAIWCNANPLYEAKVVDKKLVASPKMRAMTEKAFCLFAGISPEVFRRYKTGEVGESVEGLKETALYIADAIYTQKFEGASADLLNANIISRDLGLAEKKEVQANINLKDSPIEFE